MDAGKVAVAGNVTGAVEYADAGPVVEGLEGEVEVVVGFELEDGEATLAGDGEEIEEGTAGRCDRERLGVDGSIAERRVDERQIAAQDGFEPALGLEAVERIVRGGVGIAAAEEAIHEIEEEVLGGFVKESFAGACAKEDFVLAGEGAGDEAVADAGVFEAMKGEADFCCATGADFRGGKQAWGEQRAEMVEGEGGSVERGLRIDCVRKVNLEVAVVSDRACSELAGGRAEFVKLPLREGAVEPGHACAGGGG